MVLNSCVSIAMHTQDKKNNEQVFIFKNLSLTLPIRCHPSYVLDVCVCVFVGVIFNLPENGTRFFFKDGLLHCTHRPQ